MWHPWVSDIKASDIIIVFYIPNCDEKDLLKSLIEKHGGMTTEIHECFTYQLHPLKVISIISEPCVYFRLS